MTTSEENIIKKIQDFAKKLPTFPDGRIDYSHAKTALVITVFVKYGEKILLLKRSNKVSTYRGLWNTVAGYLDEPKPVIDKIFEELREEISIEEDDIKAYKIQEPFSFKDNSINRTWIIHPAVVELNKKPDIKLDWEHDEYLWINPEDINNFNTVPNLKESLKRGLV